MSIVELAPCGARMPVADRHPRIAVLRETRDLFAVPEWASPDETFHLLLHLEGDIELRLDETVGLAEGSCLLIEHRQLTRTRLGEDAAAIALSFPSTVIGVPSSRLRDATARILDTTEGVAAIFASLLRSLSEQAVSPTHSQVALHLSDAVTALLAATLIETDASEPGGVARGEAVLLAARRWIEENLHDPELSIAAIAAAQHISVSYLQKLFAADGHSVTGWIRERRCERCRRDLADPAERATSIGHIAERWGFISAAHFSRVFLKSFGLSPRDYRSAALRSAASAAETRDEV